MKRLKNTLKFLELAILMVNVGCKAQMVQTTKDVDVLKANEQ